MKRRPLLLAIGSVAALGWLARYIPLPVQAASETLDLDAIRQNWPQLLPAGAELPSPDSPLQKTNWQESLSAEAYRVLFEEGTEPAYTSPLNEEKRPGVFTCAACELPLFTSAMKYDSGTGWPSFFTTIPGRVGTKRDFKLIIPRTEYHCIRCGGHQGHVFNDGPSPTNQRYCNNGVALDFLPQDGKEALT